MYIYIHVFANMCTAVDTTRGIYIPQLAMGSGGDLVYAQKTDRCINVLMG